MQDGPRILAGASVFDPLDAEPEPERQGKPSTGAKKKAAGRFGDLNSFVDVTLAELPNRGDIAVWLILFRDARDGTARTSQGDLSRRSGMSVRGVAKALRRLEKHGLLRCVHRGGINKGASRFVVKPLSN